jgi:hypothetical protein
VRHALDRPITGIGVDRRAGKHQRIHLVWEPRCDHRRHPAALTKADKIYAAAEIVDRDDNLGEVIVDFQILHIVGGRLPIGQRHMTDAVGQESLDQALTIVIIGDNSRVACMRRVDERWNYARLSIVAQHHGPQIEAHLVWRSENGAQLVVNLGLFRHEFEILHV